SSKRLLHSPRNLTEPPRQPTNNWRVECDLYRTESKLSMCEACSFRGEGAERCTKYGIKIEDTPHPRWKQFTCSKLRYFFYGFLGPFTDYFPACGGFTRRV